MKNIFYYLALIFGLFMLSSCDPNQDANGDFLIGADYDPNNTPDPGTPGNTAGKLLKKITIDDEGDVSGFNYTYNADKKLTAVATGDNSLKIAITYQTGGNIAKILRTDNSTGSISTQEIVPVYTNNQITKINVTRTESSGSVKSIATVNYAANGWPSSVKEDIYNPENTQVIANYDSSFSYVGSNISQWKYQATLKAGLPVPIFDFLQELKLTVNLSEYDGKINPYNLLPKDFLIATVHSEADASSITGFAKNNSAKINVIFNFGGANIEDTQSVKYVYDKDGYPTSVQSPDILTTFEYQ